jgi:predicted nucleic acid-binding protein
VTLVVDTSVVMKWVVEEVDSARAQRLIGLPLAAPDLIRAELGNALWKRVVLRKELIPQQAQRGLARASAALNLVPSAPLADRALALAIELAHPVYDCFFLALAEELDVRLVTADERFLQRLRRNPEGARAIHLREWSSHG